MQHLVVKQDAGALLFVIPADDADLAALPSEKVGKLRQIESWLMNRETKIPIYFARADSQLDAIVRKLERGKDKPTSSSWGQSLFEDRFHLQTDTKEPRVSANCTPRFVFCSSLCYPPCLISGFFLLPRSAYHRSI